MVLKINPLTGKFDLYNDSIGVSPLTTKGDLYTYDTGNARLGVGTDGQLLSSDSGEGVGVKWIDAAGGTDVKAAIDSGATADYVGAASGDGFLRTSTPLTFIDGGDFVTLGVDVATIDHDALLNFVANEHIDHTSITLTAGDGLSGGGTIAANRTFSVNVDDATIEINTDALRIKVNGINNTHVDWGTGANQVSAVDVPIADAGVIITATEVEGALQENRTAIDLNTAKDTNVPTALSIGTVTAVTYGITSDGGVDDIVLPEADTNDAGLLGADKWDEIVANTVHKSSDGSDHAFVDQDVTSGGAPTFTADNLSDGGGNAIITTTQETNFETAYTHSQDNLQAHSDYLLNIGDQMDGDYTIDHTSVNAFIVRKDSSGTIAFQVDTDNDMVRAYAALHIYNHLYAEDDPMFLYDTNDNELVSFDTIASAVNYLTIANSSTSNGPEMTATGSDANIDVKITPKGTNGLRVGSSGRSEFGEGIKVNDDDGDSDSYIKDSSGNYMSYWDAGNSRQGWGTNTPAEQGHFTGNLKVDGTFTNEYMVLIWAEENATLGAGLYEWAYGNGANTPSTGGVNIYVPSGYSCEVVAMSLNIGGLSPSATVEVVLNGTPQGASANIVLTSTNNGTSELGTPLAIVNGDRVNFRTTSASSTASPCLVTMYLRYYR